MDIWDVAARIGFHATEADKKNMNNQKYEATIYIDCAAAATERVVARFGTTTGRRDNNEANAFKHTLWNAYMVFAFTRHIYGQTWSDFNTPDSQKWANSVAWAVQRANHWASGHEEYSSWGNSDNSRRMDYINNERGREIARVRLLNAGSKAAKDEDMLNNLANDVMAALKGGRLEVISKEGLEGYY
jgi:hypothetical protein